MNFVCVAIKLHYMYCDVMRKLLAWRTLCWDATPTQSARRPHPSKSLYDIDHFIRHWHRIIVWLQTSEQCSHCQRRMYGNVMYCMVIWYISVNTLTPLVL